MDEKTYRVLFLCTGNSARSIIAECILNWIGAGRFKAFSAGSQPRGEIHPLAIDLLKSMNFETDRLRSKDWNEFSGPHAEPMSFVFTLCDSAVNEVCPVWPGQPTTAHWGLPDPAAVMGIDAFRRAAFADCTRMLTNRISVFVSLPMRSPDKPTLQRRLEQIGAEEAERAV